MLIHLVGWYTTYTFQRALSPNRIFLAAKFTLRPSLAFSYIGSVTAWHSSSGVDQTLGRGTRNGITELSLTAPPIFGWMAIKLGIGPRSSYGMWWLQPETVITVVLIYVSDSAKWNAQCYQPCVVNAGVTKEPGRRQSPKFRIPEYRTGLQGSSLTFGGMVLVPNPLTTSCSG